MCGTLLFVASAAQQFGLTLNPSTAKAGFLTAMYVVLVPIFGLVLGRRGSPQLGLSVAIAVCGLYLLCMQNGFGGVERSDMVLLLCAVLFSFQIMAVNHYGPQMDGVRLSLRQFLVVAVESSVAALLLEHPAPAEFAVNAVPLLYCGVMSSGVAYTLQILGQRDMNPAVGSLIMCLESVFSALGGWLLLGQNLSMRESAGCTLIFAAVLMLVALGGCFSEHSGVINLGLEGIMVIGALGGALVMRYLPSGTSAFVTILLTLLGSVALGVLFSTLLAVACINFKADQTIVGTAMNMLSVAAATVIVKALNTAVNPDDVSATIQYIEPRKAFSFQIGAFEGNWFMVIAVIALIVAYVTLYKPRFGLRLMACGEHPQAADSVGINVYKMRYAGVVISGALGAIGGMAYIVPPVQTWNFEVGVAGAGFLAMAVMIFGQWKPFNICGAAMFFAVFKSLANIADSTFLAQLHWSSNIYNMMPFVASMIILAFTSKNSMAPKAEGIPYDKGSR